MRSWMNTVRRYAPDPTVLDERPAFDGDISRPFFHKGGPVGCLTLHGIGGTPANVRVLSDALAAEGYTVFSPMLPGHGETVRALNASTDKQWLQCAFDGLLRLRDEGCTQLYVLGLSLGGVLCGILAEEADVDGAVLICPPLRTQRFLRFARRVSPLLPYVRYPEAEEGQRARRNDPYAQMYNGFSTLKLVDLNRLARRLRRHLARISCPVLFVSAQYDNKVDPIGKTWFGQGAVNARQIEYLHMANSPHGCTYGPERDALAAAAVDFVRRHSEKEHDTP